MNIDLLQLAVLASSEDLPDLTRPCRDAAQVAQSQSQAARSEMKVSKNTCTTAFTLLVRYRSQNFKLLRSPRIDSKEPIPPGCVAWRAGTTTLCLLGSYSPHRCLKIPAQHEQVARLFSHVLGLIHPPTGTQYTCKPNTQACGNAQPQWELGSHAS